MDAKAATLSVNKGIAASPTTPPRAAAAFAPVPRNYRPLMVFTGRIVLVGLLLAFWQWASGRIADPFFISRPSEIFRVLWTLVVSGELLYNLAATAKEAFVGYVVGGGSAIILGFLLGRVRLFGELLEPFIVAFFSIPKLALAPLFILWFGIGFQSKVALASLLVFYMTFFNTYAGVQKVDVNLINIVRVMGASRWRLLQEVILPASFGWVLVGLRMAVPYALMGAVVGEIMAGNIGLGYLIQSYAAQFNTTGVFAVLLILAVLGFALNRLLGLVDRRSQEWNQNAGESV